MLAYLLFLCIADSAHGHGFLTFPTARRLEQKRSQYTGITAFGAGQHITNCGRDGLSIPSDQDVITELRSGSITKFDITIDAHHAGHLEMRLCPFVIDSDDQDISGCVLLKRATASEAGVTDCTGSDDRDICAPVDPWNDAWWYLGPRGSQGKLHSMWFRVPSNVTCPDSRCTIQFTWKTANSCNPHPSSYCNYYHNVDGPHQRWCTNWFCGGFCTSNSGSADNCGAATGDRSCCSEVFTNCAEVSLGAHPGGPTSVSPSTAPTVSTSSSTPVASTPATSTNLPTTVVTTTAAPPAPPSTTSSSTGTDVICVRNSCDENEWCNAATLQSDWYQSLLTWCPKQPVDRCPTPHCKAEPLPVLEQISKDESNSGGVEQSLLTQQRKSRPRAFLGRDHMMIQSGIWRKGGMQGSTCSLVPATRGDAETACE